MCAMCHDLNAVLSMWWWPTDSMVLMPCMDSMCFFFFLHEEGKGEEG
jgi:hypothetical protein